MQSSGHSSQFLLRGNPSKPHIRALVIVVPEPTSGVILNLFGTFEQVLS